MNRVEAMQHQGQSYSVKFLELTRIYAKDKTTIICIFEGEDEKYYSARLDIKLGQNKWKGINTGGKKEVLKLYNTIISHDIYEKSSYVCFIDYDFENWFINPCPSKIYVTPCYSIENLYSTESCFLRVISSEFGITEFNENSGEFNKCIEVYRNRINDFNAALYKFNCWVKAHRIMEKETHNVIKLNVTNIKTSKLVKISLESIEILYDKENLLSVFKDSNELIICPIAMADASEELMTINQTLYFRGKQQIDFMRELLTKLKLDWTSNNPKFFSKKGKTRLNLSKDNCISELSQYADTPPCLNSFLDSIKTIYVA